MILEDLNQSINQAFQTFNEQVLPNAMMILVSLITITIGLVLARLSAFAINELSKLLSVEKTLTKIPNYANLIKQQKGFSLTDFISKIAFFAIFLIFLFTALQNIGFKSTTNIFDIFTKFWPSFLEGSLILFLGALASYLVATIFSILWSALDLPYNKFFTNIIAMTIILFSALQALLAFGVDNEIIKYMVIALIAALSLSIGLGTKDLIKDYLKTNLNLKGGEK